MIEFKKFIHYGKDLEEAILGACLLEKTGFGRTYGIVDKDSFYFENHKTVYGAMKELYDSNRPIDILTVTEIIVSQRGISELAGSSVIFFVTQLTNSIVSSAHIEYHCHLIKEMWRRREIVKLKASYDDDPDTRRSVQKINDEIQRILGQEIKREWYDMSEMMYDLIKHQVDMANGRKTFVTTGFKGIDKLNGGFYNGQMIVIGARPSVGKSALMGQMALKIARSGKSVGIISLEMNNTEIAARLASIETDIEFWKVFRTIARDQELHEHFYNQIRKTAVNLPIYLSDKTRVNINEIRAKAIKLKASKGCDCIFIDYLQLIESTSENKNYNREQEVARMSRGIKMMAQELDIPVVVLCQLNRAVTSRDYKKRFPVISDLRESGAIEQDADVVMFIHRDFVSGFQVDENNQTTEFRADLLGPKWRNGSPFHLELDFDPPKMKFSERVETGWTPVQNYYEKETE